jgi:hypothetical protein
MLRTVPSEFLVRLLVRHCISVQIEIPPELVPYKPRETFPRTRKDREKTLIAALGLKTNKSEESIEFYNGNYLLFTLDLDANVVVSPHVLSSELGDDGAPIYRARRRVTDAGTVYFVGAYFANEHQLYLVGSPRGSVELRLSIFHIIHKTRQAMLRGSTLRVSNNTIFSTRCVLVRDEFKLNVRRTLVYGEHQKASFTEDHPEIANYLYGVENPPYIKISQKD